MHPFNHFDIFIQALQKLAVSPWRRLLAQVLLSLAKEKNNFPCK